MKKFGVIFAILVIASFGWGIAAEAQTPYVVDLKTLPFTINEKPFTKQYDDLLIPLPEFAKVDFTKYRRVTVHLKFFNEKKAEQDPTWSSNAIVSLVYDPGAADKDLRGGSNVPLKELNAGMQGGDATISTDGGSVVRFNKAPKGILIQNTGIDVKYIQLTKLVFHNGNYTSD